MQKVLFIGDYMYGKRTLVNAILRKQVLSTGLVDGQLSCFVNEIVSGDSERCFSVNYDGSKELLNLDELRKIMTDDFEINPLLRGIEYIVHECPDQANNLTFTIVNMDMDEYPCYHYMYSRYSHKILANPRWENDAVVYVMNATSFFSKGERRYIEKYLSDGPNSNLFFCINQMDHMKKDVSLIKKYTKEALKRVFTTNGVFDEALYQSRVFFISAYHSLNARLGKPSHTFSGDVYVKDVDTGVPEFEYTLRKFLQQQSIEKQQR